MKNLSIEGLENMEGLEQTKGSGDIPGDVWWDFLDFLIDYYPTYVDNGCPGVYNEGCNTINMGLSGNTAFSGY